MYIFIIIVSIIIIIIVNIIIVIIIILFFDRSIYHRSVTETIPSSSCYFISEVPFAYP